MECEKAILFGNQFFSSGRRKKNETTSLTSSFSYLLPVSASNGEGIIGIDGNVTLAIYRRKTVMFCAKRSRFLADMTRSISAIKAERAYRKKRGK